MTKDKNVEYSATNTYSTLNTFTSKTKNVWLVFHGMGYLSRYFITYFSELNAEENFIIAPQAPSKYYQDKNFKRVGASWLTKENTQMETENVLKYVDAVFSIEKPETMPRFLVLGYSQGVSIATRWLASRNLQCDELILHSGAIPKELTANDFEYLTPNCNITYLYGNNDEYINEARKTEQQIKGSELFGQHLKIKVFNGTHEVNRDFLMDLALKNVS